MLALTAVLGLLPSATATADFTPAAKSEVFEQDAGSAAAVKVRIDYEAQICLNPYGISVQTGGVPRQETLISNPITVTNLSTMAIDIKATPSATVYGGTKLSEIYTHSAYIQNNPLLMQEKHVFMFLQMRTDSSSWITPEKYVSDNASAVLIKESGSSTLTASSVATNSAVEYRIIGDCNYPVGGDPWVATGINEEFPDKSGDGVVVRIVFQFTSQAKYNVTFKLIDHNKDVPWTPASGDLGVFVGGANLTGGTSEGSDEYLVGSNLVFTVKTDTSTDYGCKFIYTVELYRNGEYFEEIYNYLTNKNGPEGYGQGRPIDCTFNLSAIAAEIQAGESVEIQIRIGTRRTSDTSGWWAYPN